MTKREIVWLVIRLAGVYFLWQAVESAFGFVAGAGMAAGTLGAPEAAAPVLLSMAVKAFLYSLLGFYCVGNGRLLFRVLSRESVG